MKFKFLAVYISVLLALVTTVVPGQEKKVYSTKTSLAEAERAFALMSVEVGQKESFLEFLGDWGVQFGPAPISAKDNFANEPATEQPQKRELYWEPYYGDVSVSDDLGFNVGPWVVRENAAGQKIIGQGYFLSVWKRLPDKTWREYVDMGIGVPAPGPDHSFGKPFQAARELKKASFVKTGGINNAGELEAKFAALSKAKGLLSAYRDTLDKETIFLRYAVGLIKGKQSIEDYIAAGKFDQLSLDLSPLDGDVSKKGDLAYSYGKYQLGSEGNIREKGYYVHVWRRGANNEWKLAAGNLAPLPEYRKPPKPG